MTALKNVFSAASLSTVSLTMATLLFSTAGQAAEPVKVKKWKVSAQMAILNSDVGQNNYTGLGFFREFKTGIYSGISYLNDHELSSSGRDEKALTNQMLFHLGYGQAFDQHIGYRLGVATGIASGEFETDDEFNEPCTCHYAAFHGIAEVYYLKSASKEFALQGRYMAIDNKQIGSGFGVAASYRFRF